MMTQSIFLELISTWKQPSEKEPKFIIFCCFCRRWGEGGMTMDWWILGWECYCISVTVKLFFLIHKPRSWTWTTLSSIENRERRPFMCPHFESICFSSFFRHFTVLWNTILRAGTRNEPTRREGHLLLQTTSSFSSVYSNCAMDIRLPSC